MAPWASTMQQYVAPPSYHTHCWNAWALFSTRALQMMHISFGCQRYTSAARSQAFASSFAEALTAPISLQGQGLADFDVTVPSVMDSAHHMSIMPRYIGLP
jgi:hypothetical protein